VGGEVSLELVELRFPEDPVAIEPRDGAVEGGAHELASPHASVTPDPGEPGALEHAKVLRETGERHVEASGELADRVLTTRQAHEDRAPRGIGERREGGVELRRV
jgi:hypothetical protein